VIFEWLFVVLCFWFFPALIAEPFADSAAGRLERWIRSLPLALARPFAAVARWAAGRFRSRLSLLAAAARRICQETRKRKSRAGQ
jgi:hypothetical protein